MSLKAAMIILVIVCLLIHLLELVLELELSPTELFEMEDFNDSP